MCVSVCAYHLGYRTLWRRPSQQTVIIIHILVTSNVLKTTIQTIFAPQVGRMRWTTLGALHAS